MGLTAIAQKPPIVSTFAAEALGGDATRVQDTYDWHHATYVEQPSVAAWRAEFLRAVVAARTPKACVVAPFGYGKTATAIGVWHACADAGILAVPPVACNSFAEVAYAVCDWLEFRLPDHKHAIRDAREHFLVGSAEVLAHRDEREFGIPYGQALAAIRDKLERGYLDFEDVSINLLALLETATELATRSGYRGFVVILDEGQQLVGNAAKGVLVALRQLVWGLRTRDIPFGLLITLDPDTERTLGDRAGDILHRVKDDGLYLDIRDIYDREFPAGLWQQYATTFALTPADRCAIDRPTLDALGQLCEREDLSNGPRTVVDVFRHAAARCSRGVEGGYSPIHMVSDLLDGTLHFAGDRNTLPALVAEFLNYPFFQRDGRLSDALKLISAFPRGCPAEVAEKYGLKDPYDTLNASLRGEVLTELDEGLALIELQRVARPANRLNQLLRRYWMQITDEELFAEDAVLSFAQGFVPLMFPERSNDLNGWRPEVPVRLAPDGSYCGIFEGTASPDFPLRRIAVCVLDSSSDSPLPQRPRDVDFWFVFKVSTTSRAEPNLTVVDSGSTLLWFIPLVRPDEVGLDGGLRWIEHYLNPHPISTATVINLLRYLEREGDAGPDSRDQIRIDDTLTRLQGWLLSRVLSEAGFAAAGTPVAQSGIGALTEFLYVLCRTRWPDYQPIAAHRHWTLLLDDYLHALSCVAPPIRTGFMPWSTSKAEVAAAFRQERHAGFDSRAKQYEPLLQLQIWKGDSATVRFVPLDTELRAAQQIRAANGCPRKDVYDLLRSFGNSAAEADAIIRLGTKRSLYLADGDQLVPPSGVPLAEIRDRAQSLQRRATTLGLVGAERERIDSLFAAEEHDATSLWQIDELESCLTRMEVARDNRLESERRAARSRLLGTMGALRSLAVPSGVRTLEAALFAVHARVDKLRQALSRQAEVVSGVGSTTEMLELCSNIDEYAETANWYLRWCEFASRAERLAEAEKAQGISGGASRVITRAKAVLAVDGLGSLREIAVLEINLARIDAAARASSNAPPALHPVKVAGQIADLMSIQTSGLGTTPETVGEFDPERLVRRALTYIEVRIISAWGPSKRQREMIRDIKALQREAQEGLATWVTPEGMIRADIAERIRDLHVGASQLGSPIGSDLLPTELIGGPVDVAQVVDGAESATRLSRLSALATSRSVRLTLDLLSQD